MELFVCCSSISKVCCFNLSSRVFIFFLIKEPKLSVLLIIIEVHGGLKEPAYIKYFQHFTCQNRLPMDTKIISLVSQVELFVRCLFHSFCVLFNSQIKLFVCCSSFVKEWSFNLLCRVVRSMLVPLLLCLV